MNELPDFPVDPGTLDLLWQAMYPTDLDPAAEQSSLWPFLAMMSQLGGSDTEAVEETDGDVHQMRDMQYDERDALTALITEVRRVRAIAADLRQAATIMAPDAGETYRWLAGQIDAA